MNAGQRRKSKRIAKRAHDRLETWARARCVELGLNPDNWFNYTLEWPDELGQDWSDARWPPRHAQARR